MTPKRSVRSAGAAPVAALIAALIATLMPSPVRADPVADFYKGKQIRVVMGFATGGADDSYGRLLAHYMGKYIPGEPLLLPQNMPGAGSLTAANATGKDSKNSTSLGANPLWRRLG